MGQYISRQHLTPFVPEVRIVLIQHAKSSHQFSALILELISIFLSDFRQKVFGYC